ncbi:DUF7502 family protein [Halopelagius longus]|uniref:Uncharacterized protein n=1 Tax=Halopelagius longus TaxID=1236180 RepID=A0A1H1BCL9_9EURY|nr:hypothetical protein [Halopelagius longus]RDI70715.1 hypothetical protein DWB78_02660 [Halopelagius longus]SDQ49106.1 hypothetical protein SAMN05216278_1718 [Halopelagius longus]
MADEPDSDREFDADSGFGPTVTDEDAERGSESSAARMRAALAEVRGEARKVAVVYAAIDATFLALLTNLLFRVVRPPALPEAVSLPSAVAGAGGVVPASLPFPSLLGVLVGVVAFGGEYALRTRRPLVEQFEAANPPVNEALRTARDSLDDGANTEMARRLYEEVLDRLRDTSSVELVGTRRVVTTTLLVVVLSVASVHVAVVDLDLTGSVVGVGGGDATDSQQQPDGASPDEPTDLQNGDQILGDAEDVSAGDEAVTATLDGTGGGSGSGGGGAGSPGSYDSGGFSGDAVESQQAGFAPDEQLEDAELIREYNLQIRDDRDDEDNES